MVSRSKDEVPLVNGRSRGAAATPRRPAQAGTSWKRNVLLSREKRLIQMAQGLRRRDEELSTDRPADHLDCAANLEQQEIVDGLRAVEARELAEIDAALKRLDAGTYGICERCGEAIDAARLHAVPATRSCTRCMGTARRQTTSAR